jgi:hypothetical protein
MITIALDFDPTLMIIQSVSFYYDPTVMIFLIPAVQWCRPAVTSILSPLVSGMIWHG